MTLFTFCILNLFQFHEFSRSMKTISELDFARILLRNTVLSPDEHRGYLDRLRERIPEPQVGFILCCIFAEMLSLLSLFKYHCIN